jgi:ketosteroid isomerase-like protein
MSEENVELVRPIYDAMNRHDWDAVFHRAHPDFEVQVQRMPHAGTKRGREQIQSFFEEYMATFETFALEAEEFFEDGDQVVVFVKVQAQIKGGSSALEPRIGNLWTIRDGRVRSLRMFPKREDALKAAGLRE